MEAVPSNIRQRILDLANTEKTLIGSGLAELSNINPGDLVFLEQTWIQIEVKRRREIISRLIELGEENFELNFDDIFKTFLKDSDAEIRAKSIEALWENEEISLITPFIRMLNEDSSEVVQAAAAKALSKYAMLAEVKKLGPSSSSRVIQALLAILKDKNKPGEVWRRALEAAAPLSEPEVKNAISEAYQSSDAKLRNSAIFAMGRNCDSRWLPILMKEMTSQVAETRYEAAGACGEICNEEAVPSLIKLASDRDTEVQQAAIQALGKIGGTKAKQFLVKCMNNPDEIISEAAESALKQLETEEDSFIL
jgi:HEAT repeat protein